MTRLAIVSDVHADVHALIDALAQAERLGCDLIVCAGDIVDYGLFPQETIDLLMEKGLPCIRGNHDRWAVGRGRADAPEATADGEPRDVSGWDLTPGALRYLAERPPGWDAVIDGTRIAVRHGTPRSDMEGIYPEQMSVEDGRRWLEQARADVLIVGHTHLPFAVNTLGGGLIANPGALLRSPAERQEAGAWIFDPDRGTFVPGPAPGGGTFGVLELPSRRFTVLTASDAAEVEIPRLTLGVQDCRGR